MSMIAFKNAKKTKNNTDIPLVLKEQVILNFKENTIQTKWYNPFFVFSILLLLSIVITYSDQKRNKRSKFLDFSLFFMTGFLGVYYLFFMVFHQSFYNT